jgi:hypothetical protein
MKKNKANITVLLAAMLLFCSAAFPVVYLKNKTTKDMIFTVKYMKDNAIDIKNYHVASAHPVVILDKDILGIVDLTIKEDKDGFSQTFATSISVNQLAKDCEVFVMSKDQKPADQASDSFQVAIKGPCSRNQSKSPPA